MSGSRRLAAIMFTDLVGSTEMAQSDEKRALASQIEQELLLRPRFAKHGGREVKSTGDGFLVEFDSALRAVECAVDVQQSLRERNAARPAEPLLLRIGIHLGDVERRGDDLFGDAVNIAARLEPLAESGGICVSAQVFDQVRNKVPHLIEKVGSRSLKGIHEPVDIYRVRLPWVKGASSQEPSKIPRLAVLPLANISPDPNDGYFADGLTEELISALSQIRGLRVIARTSVGQYKNTTKSIAQIGSELGVGSLLEGSVRKADGQLRITVQLIDVQTEEHRWAQTYDRKLENVFAVQAEVAERTAGALKVELLRTERENLMERPTSSLAAYESYLRGIQAFRLSAASASTVQARREHDRQAERYFEDAIRQDPRFSAAHAYLANHLLAVMGVTRPRSEVLSRTRQLVARALELNPNSSDAHTAAGNLSLQGDQDWARAEAEFQQAIALNPSDGAARVWYGFLLSTLQRFDEAKKQVLSAIELDPLWVLPRLLLAMTLLRSGDTEGTLHLLETVSRTFGGNTLFRDSLTTTLVLAGRTTAAFEMVKPLEGSAEPDDRTSRALGLALLGHPDEARALLEDWEAGRWPEYISAADLAVAHAAIGDREGALAQLERDAREGDRTFWTYYQLPFFDAIRDDARFTALLSAMKLPSSLGRSVRWTVGH